VAGGEPVVVNESWPLTVALPPLELRSAPFALTVKPEITGGPPDVPDPPPPPHAACKKA
jgi:hypothetical protein